MKDDVRPRSRPATSRRPDVPPRPDRRTAILLAAEKLFAQRGYHGVSIRHIADEAGVPLALVGYYFGPKQALFQAIFEHWNGTAQERLQALAALRGEAQRADYLERVVEAFVAPVLRLRASPEGEWYALLLGRGLHEPEQPTDRMLSHYFDPLAHAFIEALMQAFPGASRERTAWCYQFMLGSLLHHIADGRVQRLSGGVARPCDPAAAPLLTGFIAGGLRAVMPGAGTTPQHTPHPPSPSLPKETP